MRVEKLCTGVPSSSVWRAALASAALERCGRRDRVARGLGMLLGVGEHQLAPGLAHVPLDVVGEHAQEDVRAHPIGGAVVDRAHLQVDRLERAERALDVGQRLVVAHAVGRSPSAPRCTEVRMM